ncbi:MAG: dihydropteroate synthase [Lutibacter sp.]|nr:dihydropteroate synthase [Lutibacter sp.]
MVNQVEKMLSEGATFIDGGAYSSRPGAEHISEEEELSRILPVVKLLISEFPSVLISVDTFRSQVAEQCIYQGACIVNDIAAGEMDANMFSTVAKLQVPYIMMHMKGTPQNMQQNPTYTNVITDLLYYFSKKIAELRELGLNDIIADVGFGFGKTIAHNYQLLNHLALFKNLETPLLIGLSRKGMLYNPLGITAESALNATTAANTVALLNGASILRVHDVKEAVEAVKIVALLNNKG